jgi:ribosomal protein S24E
MALNIIQEKENPFLNRKEIILKINAKKTPSFKEVEELISKELSIPVERIHIEKINGRFGLNEFNISLSIYNSSEDKQKLMKKTKKTKKEGTN